MKRLILLRHAKAERGALGSGDRERVLAERGKREAEEIGAYLARHNLMPDLVVVSPSARTRETWTGSAAALDRTPPAVEDERLYDATVANLYAVLRETADSVHVLMLVGHNPSLHEAALDLIATGPVETRERLMERYPPAGLVVIDLTPANWVAVHPRCGRLERYITPREIEAETD